MPSCELRRPSYSIAEVKHSIAAMQERKGSCQRDLRSEPCCRPQHMVNSSRSAPMWLSKRCTYGLTFLIQACGIPQAEASKRAAAVTLGISLPVWRLCMSTKMTSGDSGGALFANVGNSPDDDPCASKKADVCARSEGSFRVPRETPQEIQRSPISTQRAALNADGTCEIVR